MVASSVRAKPVRASVIALIAIAVAFVAARNAVALAFRSRSPAIALRANPHDPVALSKKYYNLKVEEKRPLDRREQLAWAFAGRAALRTEPLSSGALQVLLDAADATGARQEHKLINAASAVTRRELPVELWQIEDAVSRGDIRGALVHYDRALSVHPDAGALLFPVLTGAVSEPQIRRKLAPLLARDRLWGSGFLSYFTAKTEDYPAALELFALYGGSRKVNKHRPYETVLLDRLVASGNGRLAREFGRRVAGFDVGSPTTFGISARTMDDSLLPLAWSQGSQDVVVTDFEPETGLRITVPPAEAGVAASRVAVMAPGNWVLDQTIEWQPLAAMAELSWTVRCLTKTSREPITTVRLRSQSGRHRFVNAFNVPQSCSAVQFELNAQGPINDGQAEAIIKSIALVAPRAA